ncbi:hypothetical protein SAICODRAFT_59210 [Saitoella complicata NRRL Y-17804]|uniref:uncharacterized protein n=1 Tax=Saitoella complicata (strain BCRC 22490 / CBS 7301 / JCM 7358 / NBRC 10748 / NRRL Y-17804) TaxID=698492 RepID=UPI000867D771|nr:uncharacterized protein SAICODRAFT_59210 [Saitoella complicata NRRL Y-17804]ODQ51746.1 hypothetical protein SAICODRAFT_59210 [Saitoella complicata NRRL Y-17804]
MLSSIARPSQLRIAPALRRSPLLGRMYSIVVDAGKYQPGQKLSGFTVARSQVVPELELTATQLIHDRTGAEHLHISRDDQNNVFAVGFETPPTDSTGVPHILEHTTLCGSEKYPVRDPFFQMLPRSLQNFMNAFTAADYTFYPFATTNKVDYENLRDVYMDATFFPKLRKLDFLQEGWRLEHEDPKDTSTPITFKGVVYNEMKGQMSDASYLFYVRYQQHMFPGTCYSHDSGGNPMNITDLTYEQLKAFHKKHYHPSNAKFFTYGNFPLEDHAEKINAKLEPFVKDAPEKSLKDIVGFDSPKAVTLPCPVDPLADPTRQLKTSLSYLANEASDVFTTFSLRVLSNLLLDGHSSPLYQALIDTNVGSEWSPNTGYDPSAKTTVFSIGLQGVKEGGVIGFQETVERVLKEVVAKGFEQKRVDAVLHQMELSLKHKTATFGMSVLQSMTSGFFNGVDPMDMLEWNKTVDRFKEELAKGRYLEGLVEKYLLGNQRRLAFTMEPSKTFTEDLAKEEVERLKGKVDKLTEEDKKRIQEEGLALLKNQEEKGDPSCLPTLHVSDIAKEGPKTPLEYASVENVPVQIRAASTNGLTYFRAVSSLNDLPDELKLYLPLFADCLSNLGTKTRTMAELDDEIMLRTGGLRASTMVSTGHSDLNQVEEGLALSGYSLDGNVQRMFELFRQLLLETNFDNVDKLKSLIRGNASGIVNSIADSGHAFARTYAASMISPSARSSEIFGGMTQMKLISQLATIEDLSEVIAKLKAIAQIAFSRSSMRVALTCGQESLDTNEQLLGEFLRGFPQHPALRNAAEVTPHGLPSKAYFPLPYSVTYSGVAVKGVPYTHPDGAPLQILSSLLTHRHLHREIREKGGAYGGGATYNGLGGIFSYYSYRDPNAERTLKTFTESGEWARDHEWSERDLEEAKLSVFQKIDAPISVSQEGMASFLEGVNDQQRQLRRERLLAVDIPSIRDVAERYLVNAFKSGQSSTAVLGEKKEFATKENGWELFNWGAEAAEKVQHQAEEPAAVVIES